MTRKLNILFLSSWYPNRVTTTKGNFVQRHAEAVATKCNVVTIHVLEDPDLIDEKYQISRQVENGVDTIRVYTRAGIPKLAKWTRYFKGYDKAIQIMLETFRPDVIHGNVFFPVGIVAKKWGVKWSVPIVFTEHLTAYLPANQDNLKPRHLRSIKTSALATNRIIPVSNDLMNAMKELQIGDKYEVVPNVVDTSLFKPGTNTGTRKRIIHVSTAKDFHKNVSGILRTIAKLKELRNDFELLII
ncbi:MAG: glycosyltransferase, partial [Flavobacteriales bacterium]|nr:glycosyltransferase [Flavobacteriales bacterium]